MRQSDFIRLLLLAAIWGASFLFMRVIAPVLGPIWTAELRVGLAGLALCAWMLFLREPLPALRQWKQYLLLGAASSGFPAVLYSYAALHVPAGYSAIMNATTPLWGALMASLFLGEKLTQRKLAGMFTGVLGVALLVKLGPVTLNTEVLLALLACSLATICYALAGVYTKKLSVSGSPTLLATASQVGAAVMLLPALPFSPVHAAPSVQVVLAMAALALICSALAYLLYFRLISDVGPTRALTVTFLIPLFALIWGAVFLDEHITLSTLAGCAAVVLATWLVAGSPKKAST
ncbi:DMT family transporter [Undibacterium squillarum]|uniref:Transporter n=1 Tax=Undibacterium squillarum TaxID=1131567 RepID=A0ABQ2XXK1_9BURK|nr:EamA family transporter [Undibacterium squillarum]GGX38759.1 transporter [Undibacterium squillarum]